MTAWIFWLMSVSLALGAERVPPPASPTAVPAAQPPGRQKLEFDGAAMEGFNRGPSSLSLDALRARGSGVGLYGKRTDFRDGIRKSVRKMGASP